MHNAETRFIGIAPASERVRDAFCRLGDARCDYSQFVDAFPSAVRSAYGATAVSLWAHDSVHSRLIHVASDGIVQDQMDRYLVQVHDSHSGRCVERKRPIIDCELSQQYGSHIDQHPKQTIALGVTRMHSVPVLNLANPNQVLFVINLLFRDKRAENEPELNELASVFGCHYEALLRSFCTRQENLLRIDLAERAIGESLKGLCNELAGRVQVSTQSNAVAVFLKNSSDVVEVKGFTVNSIRLLSERYAEFVVLAMRATESNRESVELPTDPSSVNQISESMVAVPIRDFSGNPVGAVVCLKSSTTFKTDGPVVFTPDNITICDWLGQAFAPFYELMSSEDHRLAALSRLGHELKGPVTGMNAAISFASRAPGQNATLSRYLGDLRGYTGAMGEILQAFELSTDENLELSLHIENVDWVVDLVAPATKAMEQDLKQRGVKSFKIARPGLDQAPEMWLDRHRMLQVVFNLLENAVKYAKDDGADVKIEITFSTRNGRYEVCFRDWGIGVPLRDKDRIFLMGVRASNATSKQIAGKGFGLAISRRIVRAHGGELILRRRKDGSDFVILLPINRPQNLGVSR